MSRAGKTIIGSTDRGPWQNIAVLGWMAGVRALFIMVCLAACTIRAGAVIFYSTADPTYNTTAPTGSLNNSGWQWVGYWDGFQGTPIGPHHFLTARHVGGAVGDQFIFGGVTYITTAFYDDTVSDLRICEISGSFPTWASLYRTSDEVGRSLTVFGRGLSRGAEVRDAATNTLRGWQWGSGGGVLRWGQNAIASVENGGSYWGDLLYATFDASGGANEAHLAVGDSSGPVFINDGTAWRLAGIAAAVDAYFNTTNSGSGFNAAIFDARGLYIGSSGSWTLVSGQSAIPSGFYATRVSERTAWIDGIVPPQDPDNSGDAPLLSPAGLVVLAGLFFGFGARALRRHVGPVSLT
jgi:hypothetical protein